MSDAIALKDSKTVKHWARKQQKSDEILKRIAMDWPSGTPSRRDLRGGEVMPSQMMPGCHRIETYTDEGSEVYEGAFRVTSGDAQSELRPVPLRRKWNTANAYINWESLARSWVQPDLFDEEFDANGDLTTEAGQRPDALVELLTATHGTRRQQLVCEAEITQFDAGQREKLLPLLWQYILENRDSNDREELVAVGSAIRKYVAMMPMEQMGKLTVLLISGCRSPLPIETEIEVAKMIYRNFEVHPPAMADPEPELAQRLYEIAQAYTNPRVLLRDKYSAAASLAIVAIVAMRSELAEQAWSAACQSPYRWFTEIVHNDLAALRDRWLEESGDAGDAVEWLDDLKHRVILDV